MDPSLHNFSFPLGAGALLPRHPPQLHPQAKDGDAPESFLHSETAPHWGVGHTPPHPVCVRLARESQGGRWPSAVRSGDQFS